MRTVWLVLALVAGCVLAVPVAAGSPETRADDSRPVSRARVIQLEVSSRYTRSRANGLEVTEASSTGVIESFTLVSAELTDSRVVSAENGIYYAICSVGALCPYPAQRFARPAAAFRPRRLAIELAVRTFTETTANVVAVSLPTRNFVLFVIERNELAGDDLSSLVEDLGRDPRHPPSDALRELVDRTTRHRIFAFAGFEPTPSGRDSLGAVALWSARR